MISKDHRPNESKLEEVVQEVRDLSDFCQKWPAIKELMINADTGETECGAAERQVMVWLTHLADRVCLSGEYL